MSQYSVGGAQETSGVAHFIVSVGVEATKFSITLILQTLAVEEQSSLVQSRLGLPLSLSGTLSSEGGDNPGFFSILSCSTGSNTGLLLLLLSGLPGVFPEKLCFHPAEK